MSRISRAVASLRGTSGDAGTSEDAGTEVNRPTGHRRDRARTGLAGLGTGVLIAAALPPWGWWPLAFAGIAAFDRLIADRPWRARFGRAWIVGLGLYAPSLWWMRDLTLPGYVIAAMIYAVLLGVAASVVPAAAPGRWLALPGAIALVELLRWSWPFGGVPLSSLAVGQVAGPLAPVLRVGGSLLLVEVTVIAGLALTAVLARHWRAAAVAAGLVAVSLAVAALAPRARPSGEIDVALVQGGGPQGTRAVDTDERVVFERHLQASEAVQRPVDLVVWPEDVVDVDVPIEDSREGGELSDLARELDAPIVAGVVEDAGEEHFRNAAVVFDRDGEIVARYDKVHRVPFGEYVPLRGLVEQFAGDELTARDAIVGETPAILDTGPGGRVAVAISWEVFFGDRIREGVERGGEIVLNPTNGSSYTGTQVQTQQVATSRMRAIENDRWVLQVAPTGFTAVVGPDGTVHQRSSVSERTVLHGTVGQRTGTTLYTRVGLLPAWLVALASLAAGWGLVALQRRRPDEDGSSPSVAGEPPSDADRAKSDDLPGPGRSDPVTMPSSSGRPLERAHRQGPSPLAGRRGGERRQ
jgi:apolipoprotein N-acyltransferase